MGYDQELADRVGVILEGVSGLVVKEMFGGLGYMVHGNMGCGVNGSELIVRVGPQAYEEALGEPHVHVFDMTGRAMRGWVVVKTQGIQSDAALRAWVKRGVQFAQSLPPK